MFRCYLKVLSDKIIRIRHQYYFRFEVISNKTINSALCECSDLHLGENARQMEVRIKEHRRGTSSNYAHRGSLVQEKKRRCLLNIKSEHISKPTTHFLNPQSPLFANAANIVKPLHIGEDEFGWFRFSHSSMQGWSKMWNQLDDTLSNAIFFVSTLSLFILLQISNELDFPIP